MGRKRGLVDLRQVIYIDFQFAALAVRILHRQLVWTTRKICRGRDLDPGFICCRERLLKNSALKPGIVQEQFRDAGQICPGELYFCRDAALNAARIERENLGLSGRDFARHGRFGRLFCRQRIKRAAAKKDRNDCGQSTASAHLDCFSPD